MLVSKCLLTNKNKLKYNLLAQNLESFMDSINKSNKNKSIKSKSITSKSITRMSSIKRKAKIVNAVLSIADKNGPDRLSTATIAKASGLTHAGIFRHFPAKQDIWIAVANEIALQAEKQWAAPLAKTLTPRQKIEALVSAQLAFLANTPAILTILFSYELQCANKELRNIFTNLMMKFKQYLTDEFALSGNEKNASDLSFLIIALIQGLALRGSISQRSFNFEEEGKKYLKLQLDMINFND